MGPHPATVATAAVLFVPAAVAVWTQPLLISSVLLMGATFSTLYHSLDEMHVGAYDLVGAVSVMFVMVVMWIVLAAQYSFFYWRAWVSSVLAITGLVLFLCCGSDTFTEKHPNDIENYDLYHSLWHGLTAVSTLIIVLTPIDLSLLYRVRFSTLMSVIYTRPPNGLLRTAADFAHIDPPKAEPIDHGDGWPRWAQAVDPSSTAPLPTTAPGADAGPSVWDLREQTLV